MLETIKGTYENGIIKPLEKVHIQGKRAVLITFLDFMSSAEKKDVFRRASGSWADVDTDKLKREIFAGRGVSKRKMRVL